MKKLTHRTGALREIAFSLTACSSSPCFHDGTCLLDNTGSYKCACLAGYTGQHCENREFASGVGVKVSHGAGVERVWGACRGCCPLLSTMVPLRWWIMWAFPLSGSQEGWATFESGCLEPPSFVLNCCKYLSKRYAFSGLE